MKNIAILILSLSLGGCFYQTVDYLDLEAATRICKDSGGVKIISESFDSKTNVICFDDDKKLPVDAMSLKIEIERNRHD